MFNRKRKEGRNVPQTAHPRPPKGRGHPTISHSRYSTKHEAQRKLTHLNSSDDRLTYSSYKNGNKCNYLQEDHLQDFSIYTATQPRATLYLSPEACGTPYYIGEQGDLIDGCVLISTQLAVPWNQNQP